MHRTLVLNVVGLTGELLGEHTPHLCALAARGCTRPIRAVTPAVTCSAQATYLTGLLPTRHGIVANGWYFRDLNEIWLWRQSNRLIQGDKLWETARSLNPEFTCANLFWWYNMNSSVDWSVTPRPMYPADGRKLPDVYTQPAELRDVVNAKLGMFPLFRFWGPNTDIVSSRWISDCALHVDRNHAPTLSLVYLPHLDYGLQRHGPEHPSIAADLRQVDSLCGELIENAEASGQRIIVLSEYGITSVRAPIHINRALREAGLIRVREELGTELLDPGASAAFAVSDHQIAHVYLRDPARWHEVHALLEKLPGVERVLARDGRAAAGLDHPRAGDLVAISERDRWFSYYYWLDDARAPDFARTVDIHRKPGFDPAELFVDPTLRWPELRVAQRLLMKKLGMRTLMDVIGLDASGVGGSHGRPTDSLAEGPVWISSEPGAAPESEAAIDATEVRDSILSHVFEEVASVGRGPFEARAALRP